MSNLGCLSSLDNKIMSSMDKEGKMDDNILEIEFDTSSLMTELNPPSFMNNNLKRKKKRKSKHKRKKSKVSNKKTRKSKSSTFNVYNYMYKNNINTEADINSESTDNNDSNTFMYKSNIYINPLNINIPISHNNVSTQNNINNKFSFIYPKSEAKKSKKGYKNNMDYTKRKSVFDIQNKSRGSKKHNRSCQSSGNLYKFNGIKKSKKSRQNKQNKGINKLPPNWKIFYTDDKVPYYLNEKEMKLYFRHPNSPYFNDNNSNKYSKPLSMYVHLCDECQNKCMFIHEIGCYMDSTDTLKKIKIKRDRNL